MKAILALGLALFTGVNPALAASNNRQTPHDRDAARGGAHEPQEIRPDLLDSTLSSSDLPAVELNNPSGNGELLAATDLPVAPGGLQKELVAPTARPAAREDDGAGRPREELQRVASAPNAAAAYDGAEIRAALGDLADFSPKVNAEIAEQREQLLNWSRSPKKTLVYIHSMSLDAEVLKGVVGIEKYERRAIIMTLRARDPNVNVIMVTSDRTPDYVFEHVLDGLPDAAQIRKRVRFVHLSDGKPSELGKPLSARLLEDDQARAEIRAKVAEFGVPAAIHYFNVTEWEHDLAKKLGMPYYGTHPAVSDKVGTKTGGKTLFRRLGLAVADGTENVGSLQEIEDAVLGVWSRNPEIKKVMIKLNIGTSGLGNRLFTLPPWSDSETERRIAVRAHLKAMQADPKGKHFLDRMAETRGIVEKAGMIDTEPSGQVWMLPNAEARLLSTHKQRVVNGNYEGANFPAQEALRDPVSRMTELAGRGLAALGGFGRMAIDFIKFVDSDLIASEPNVRVGGTTHIWDAAKLVTNAENRGGRLFAPDGTEIFYNASDHTIFPGLIGMSEREIQRMLDIFRKKGLLYNDRRGEGVRFHLLEAIAIKGNVGYVAIARGNPHRADEIEEQLLIELAEIEAGRIRKGLAAPRIRLEDEALRRRFNSSQFSEAGYRALLQGLEDRAGIPIEDPISQTPLLLDPFLVRTMEADGLKLIDRLMTPEYRALSERAIPANFRVPNEAATPMFVAVDFALTKDGPKLVEMQAHSSEHMSMDSMAKGYKEAFGLGDLRHLLSGLTQKGFEKIMRRAILGGHDPKHVVLLEIDPMKQSSVPDFLLAQKLTGVQIVDVTHVKKLGRKLFYPDPKSGKLVLIKRIYNRIVPDEFERKNIRPGFKFTDNIDVEWAGQPNWFFRISKFALPYLSKFNDLPFVPKSWFLSDLKDSQIPSDLDNYVLKPLFSFGGQGVKVGPSRADIDAIPAQERSQWILMERIQYEPFVQTPFGPSKAEVRIMYVWSNGKPVPVITFVRMGRGQLMNVKFNHNDWTGLSVGLFRDGR